MRDVILSVHILLSLLLLAGATSALAEQTKAEKRIFMFVGTPSAEGWQVVLNGAADRKKATAAALKELDVDVLSYYFGLSDGKNYITVAVPDGETTQALLLMRLATPLMKDYYAIELVPSEAMPKIVDKVKSFNRVESKNSDR
jgi:hypothetical protein